MRRLATAVVLAALLPALAACSRTGEPYRSSRAVLGTAVTIAVYGGGEAAPSDVRAAFARMAAVEHSLSPYDRGSDVAAIDADPYTQHRLPADALDVLRAADALGVSSPGATGSPGAFSPALWGVTSLYSFGASETVPRPVELAEAVRESRDLVLSGDRVAFRRPPAGVTTAPVRPGLDFGGAAKGLALDEAAAALEREPGVLLTAGSSTLAIGSKPDSADWSVGVEDPRAEGRVIAVIRAPGASAGERALSVSTSGDYQVYFERGGVRYHHILDPATGRPARGARSLTVFGTMSGLDADILSTALFVMGPDAALRYARAHGVGVVLVDVHGRMRSFVPAGLRGMRLEPGETPKR